MTMSGTPESFEQLISAAMASGDYKPVWARFVRTRFFTPMHQPGQNAAGALRVLPGPKDGKPLLMVTQEREKLATDTAPDASLLSGAEIVRQLTPGVAIGVVLGKGVFTIPAKLVDSIRSKLGPAPTPVAAATAPTPPATTPGSKFPDLLSTLPAINLPLPDATPAAPPVAGNSFPSLPPLNAALDPAPAANAAAASPAAQTASATPSAATAPETPAPAAADWDDDLVDLDLLPSKNPAPAAAPAPARPAAPTPVPASSQWQILGDDHASPAAPAAPVAAPAPLAPLAPIGGKKPTRPLDVQALKPRNVVHAGTGMDFYVPDAWQQRTGSRSLTFFDPASGAKIEVNSMPRSDTPLEKWLEIRLPTVTKEMPFLKQVGESYAISGSEWRGKISAMVTEFQGTYHLDQEETHYLICCYRTDSMVATITVRVKSDVFEENRAVYKWLFEQVDMYEPTPVAGQAGTTAIDHAPAPPLFAMNTDGRIGRLRFLAYSIVMYLPFFALGLLIAILPGMMSIIVGIAGFVALIWLPIRLMVLRMHDLNLSGKWLWLLLLLSGASGMVLRSNQSVLVSALIWLALILVSLLPGNKHENSYGDPSVPNPLWVKVVAGVFIALQILGMLSAIKLSRDKGTPWANARVAETRWQSFSPADKRFSVDIPGIPWEEEAPKKRMIMQDIHIYTVISGGAQFTVNSFLAKGEVDDSEAALERFVAGISEGENAVQESKTPVTINGLSGVDFRLRMPHGGVRDHRILIKDRETYLLMVESQKDKDDRRKVDMFMNSFRLNN